MKHKRLNLKNCLFSFAIALAVLVMNCLGISGGHFDFCSSELSHDHHSSEPAIHNNESTLHADTNHHSACQNECCPGEHENHQHQADYLGSRSSVKSLFPTSPVRSVDKPFFVYRPATGMLFNIINEEIKSNLQAIHQSICLII